ncbi:MAG TPA: tetratricopeptide repeat protein [Pyrinomonadaceae bacterium]|nr:tetratricopeptide repeat protein [Pyrinomonadaceae bacterium]
MAAQILIIVLALGLLPTTTLQTNSNSISGHVSNDQRMPLADLRVELLNEVDSVIRTVKTDGSGLFVFRKLSDGTFQVRIQTSGTNYVSQTKRVELARPHGFGAAFEELDFVLVTRNNNGSIAKPGVVFVQEVPEPARKQFQKATELLNKANKRQEAFAALKSAIDLFPQYFDALELLGREQVKDREYEAAIPALTKALQVNSRSFASSFALGVAQYNLKQLQPAIESLRRAVLLNERSINANLWLGIALRQTSRPDEAEAYLRRADVLADSKLPDAHWQLALLFNQLKRYKEAADELEIFLKVQPNTRDVELIKKLIQRLRQQSVPRNPERKD